MRSRQIGSGPEDFTLISAQLYVDDTPVESGDEIEVDPETTHEIRLDHNVANADPRSWGDPIGVWSTCMTVYDVSNNRPLGSVTCKADGSAGGGRGIDAPVLNIGRVPGPNPRILRVKCWANQNDNAVPPASNYW